MKKYLAVILGAALLASSGAIAQPNRDHNGAQQQQHYNQSRGNQGNAHQWARGQRVSAEYRSANSRYRVADYGRYRLHAPGRGQQWVRVNNDYMLVGLASGLIADIVRHQ